LEAKPVAKHPLQKTEKYGWKTILNIQLGEVMWDYKRQPFTEHI